MFGVVPNVHVRVNQAGEAKSPATFPRSYSLGCFHVLCLRCISVRAWRGLRRNDKYAAKLEIKLAKKRAVEEAKAQAKALAEQQKNTPKKNPFSVCSVIMNSNGDLIHTRR